jgi:transcriptional repressor NrdR
MERRDFLTPDKEIGRGFKAMRCPFCGHEESKVIDSRESKNGLTIRRRRECLECEKRFTTYEKIEEIPYMIVKKDGRRQRFESEKIMAGLLKACEKRPVPVAKLEEIVEEIETSLQERPEKEISAEEIGQFVMGRLKALDKVAYVRFASVYRDFKDVLEFKKELETLLKEK